MDRQQGHFWVFPDVLSSRARTENDFVLLLPLFCFFFLNGKNRHDRQTNKGINDYVGKVKIKIKII